MPILPPKYTTPAPAKHAASTTAAATLSAATVPSAADALTAAAAGNLAPLETRLMYYSYVGGFQPTAADAQAVVTVFAVVNEQSATPNVARWMRSVRSFSTEEQALWK